MKMFSIRDDVFKTEPLFVVGCSYADMKARLDKRFSLCITEESEKVAGKMLTFGVEPWRVVWVKRSNDLACLAHEIFHLVTRICHDKGIPIVAHHPNGENGDETAAYLLEFFFSKATKRLKA